MSQHKSYNIPDQSGSMFRTDLNNYLKALLSHNSGETAPINPVAGKLWYDTLNHTIKVRNSTNTAWTAVASSVTGEVNSVTTGASTVTVDNIPADTAAAANTIVERDSSGKIAINQLIGNCWNADTVGGLNSAYLTNSQNLLNRDYITVTAGDYVIATFKQENINGSFNTYKDEFKLPFNGVYRIKAYVHRAGVGIVYANGLSITQFGSTTKSILAVLQATDIAVIPPALAPTDTFTGGHNESNRFNLYQQDITAVAGDTLTFSNIGATSGSAILATVSIDEFGVEYSWAGDGDMARARDLSESTNPGLF